MVDKFGFDPGNPDGLFARTVINSSRQKAFLLLAVSLVLTFVIYNYFESQDLIFQIFQWAIIAFSGLGALYGLLSIMLGIPIVILDQDGIKFISFMRRRSWKWPDVGPFSVDVKRVKNGEYFYACAFTDSNHDFPALTIWVGSQVVLMRT